MESFDFLGKEKVVVFINNVGFHFLFQIERKSNVTNELQSLREKIDKEGAKAAVHKLISLRQALKVR